MIIYCITNKTNGKQYVGCAVHQLKKRMHGHFHAAAHGNRRPLYAAMRKHGIDSFETSVIDIATSLDELYEKERKWIAKLNTKVPNGYNLTDGGEGTVGHEFTQLQRERLSQAHVGLKQSAETIEKRAATRRGYKYSTETRQRISLAIKKHWELRKTLTPEALASRSAKQPVQQVLMFPQPEFRIRKKTGPKKGSHLSVETRRKISEAAKARGAATHLLEISKPFRFHKGHRLTEETKKAVSESLKRAYSEGRRIPWQRKREISA